MFENGKKGKGSGVLNHLQIDRQICICCFTNFLYQACEGDIAVAIPQAKA